MFLYLQIRNPKTKIMNKKELIDAMAKEAQLPKNKQKQH